MAKKNLMETIREVESSKKKPVQETVAIVEPVVEEPVIDTVAEEDNSEFAFLDSLIENKVFSSEQIDETFKDQEEAFDSFINELNGIEITEETAPETVEAAAKVIFDSLVAKIEEGKTFKDSGDKGNKNKFKERMLARKEKQAKKTVKEETSAADSLHPAAKSVGDPDSLSNFGKIATMIGAANAMRSDELTKWFKEAMALIGTEGRETPAASDSNKNTLDMKASAAVGGSPSKLKMPIPHLDDKGTNSGGKLGQTISSIHMPMGHLNVKEDIDAMFTGQELSEEFREKATTLFEAAVTARVNLETIRITEEMEEEFNTAIDEAYEDIDQRLDAYLDHVADTYLDENSLAVESMLKNEITEEFIDGLKNLFAENYIDVPEDKLDVLTGLAEKADKLEEELNAAILENTELHDMLAAVARDNAIQEAAAGLSATQKEKFEALAEGITYDHDIEVFEKKLKVVKENYFPTKNSGSTKIDEEFIEIDQTEKDKLSSDPAINMYVKALSNTVKR